MLRVRRHGALPGSQTPLRAARHEPSTMRPLLSTREGVKRRLPPPFARGRFSSTAHSAFHHNTLVPSFFCRIVRRRLLNPQFPVAGRASFRPTLRDRPLTTASYSSHRRQVALRQVGHFFPAVPERLTTTTSTILLIARRFSILILYARVACEPIARCRQERQTLCAESSLSEHASSLRPPYRHDFPAYNHAKPARNSTLLLL